jgi:hypothetical protein
MGSALRDTLESLGKSYITQNAKIEKMEIELYL